VTLPEEKNDARSPLITAISAFGDSTFPMFRSKNKTLNKTFIVAQKLFERHNCTVRTAEKAFITEVLFLHRLQTFIVPKVANLPEKTKCGGKIVLTVNNHVIHVTSRVIEFVASWQLPLIRLV
jgi:hypothetical protein